MFTLGWKDILRPIRDGLRDRLPFPPKDQGPSPEERRRQQRLDALKGFKYFDTFEQLAAWKSEDADPLHRANAPLLTRVEELKGKEQKQSAKVLLCHDYSGNYHDYESSQEIGVDAESYSCSYLQHVETFVYFSHKLVCVPPPTWTNTLHRNGVKVLGTFLVEPQTPGIENILITKILQNKDGSTTRKFPVAAQLADIAHFYGFDGWLVNIEKKFPNENWDLQGMLDFLEQLKNDLGSHGQLVWYDALTINNTIAYQNTLSVKNLPFIQACGSILTNYNWTERSVTGAKSAALQHGIDPSNIYFGIDVWAQNASHNGPKRVTYPAKRGGGTNTGAAVAKLAELGHSAGIFAPAWSFEHFTGPDAAQAVDRCVWNGEKLPEDLSCDCGNGIQHQQTLHCPITKYAKRYPAGSANYFATDFSRAFAARGEHGGKLRAQLGRQSVLPHLLSPEAIHECEGLDILCGELHDEPARLAVLAERLSYLESDAAAPFEQYLHLFDLNMIQNAASPLKLDMVFKLLSSNPEQDLSLVLHFSSAGPAHSLRLSLVHESQHGKREPQEAHWVLPTFCSHGSRDLCHSPPSNSADPDPDPDPDSGFTPIGANSTSACNPASQSRVTGIGLSFRMPRLQQSKAQSAPRAPATEEASRTQQPVVEILSLMMSRVATPTGHVAPSERRPAYAIGGLRLERRGEQGEPDTRHYRLRWDLGVRGGDARSVRSVEERRGLCAAGDGGSGSPGLDAEPGDCGTETPRAMRPDGRGVPCSATTGPFAHFDIFVEGKEVGRAYASEWIVPRALVGRMRQGDGVGVGIQGVRFDGGVLGSEVVVVGVEGEGERSWC